MATMLALDPGNRETGWCIVDTITRAPVQGGKDENTLVSGIVSGGAFTVAAIEIIESYGMAVGRDVFETCEWIGRYKQLLDDRGVPYHIVTRKEEKLNICGSPRANDTTIRHALIDRFASHDFRSGKGTKANPDFFYGFRADQWSAYAVATTAIDRAEYEKESVTDGID